MEFINRGRTKAKVFGSFLPKHKQPNANLVALHFAAALGSVLQFNICADPEEG